jgi:hypothetical protein
MFRTRKGEGGEEGGEEDAEGEEEVHNPTALNKFNHSLAHLTRLDYLPTTRR